MRRFLSTITSAVFGIAAPVIVFAASALDRLDKTAKTAFPGQSAETRLPVVAGQIINFFISLLGILFLALTVYGGYLWMNARGNEQQVEKAKSLITQAVIGLTIVLAAYVITYTVVKYVGEATGMVNPG